MKRITLKIEVVFDAQNDGELLDNVSEGVSRIREAASEYGSIELTAYTVVEIPEENEEEE